MIRYGLLCDRDHQFDGWFRSFEDHDTQAKRGFIACPECGSTSVRKAIMSPAVSTSERRLAPIEVKDVTGSPEGAAGPSPSDASPAVSLANLDPRRVALVAALRELKAKVMANSDYVGANFASEARRMHVGEIEQRGIYGETSLEDAQALIEDGIEVHPLPVLPDERN